MTIYGSGKMLFVRIVEINKLMLIFGQVRLSKGYLCPARLEKGFGYGPAGLKPHAVARNRKNQ